MKIQAPRDAAEPFPCVLDLTPSHSLSLVTVIVLLSCNPRFATCADVFLPY
jgi:hypothetical protein